MKRGDIVSKDQKKAGGNARERLLVAAMDVFGKYGYEGATTRQIAGQAHVNIAAIPYYYGGKEGLYQAVIDHITMTIKAQVEETVSTIYTTSFSGAHGKEKALALLEEFLTRMIEFMVGSDQAPRISRIIIREQMYPTDAYDTIFKGFMEPALGAVALLVSVLTEDDSEETARLRAMALFGQILAFRVARETLVRLLDWQGYDREETDRIRQIVLEHTRNVFKPFK